MHVRVPSDSLTFQRAGGTFQRAPLRRKMRYEGRV